MANEPNRLTTAQVASMTGGTLNGRGDVLLTGVSDPRTAGRDQITCLSDGRYRAAALVTKAGAILVQEGTEGPFPCPWIEVKDSASAFAKLAAEFAGPALEWPSGIHPTAIISPEAVLAADVQVGPYVVIEAGVEIGAGSHIGAGCYIGHRSQLGEKVFLYPRVTLYDRTLLGDRVIIHSGTVIGADGFGYAFRNGKHEKIPQLGFVQIDCDVEIGANTTIDRGRFDRTWIQEGCKIDNLVMIAHNCCVGKHSILTGQVGLSGSTHLGQYVTIAGQSGLAGHLTIGDRTTITAQSGVARSLNGGGIYSGRHALPIKEAMKLEAFNRRLPEFFERLKKIEDRLPPVNDPGEPLSPS